MADKSKNVHTLPCKNTKLLLILVIFAGWFTGCDTFTGHIDGEITPNVPPVVEFSNVPAHQDTFAYAPVIYWKGSDADGFVEYFEYADIIDSTALAQPDYFIDFIPEEDWVRTEATADTVYLLTESGEITEHVFYLKCFDDRDAESEVIYRTFYRSNEPPYVPDIKWGTFSDEMYAHDFVLSDTLDTLYVLADVTDTWPGLSFTWRSSDPDDRDLYKIPLEYRYYLEKVPHDTIWQWTAQRWSNDQELTIAGIGTGHYKLTVWARDDGFEKSVRPASITFDVYEPSFEQTVLLMNCTYEKENFREREEGLGNVLPGTQIGDCYKALTREVEMMFPDWQYIHYSEIDTLYKSHIGKFRLIVLFSDNMKDPNVKYEAALREYVHIGGRLWVLGAFTHHNLIANTIMGLTGSAFTSNVYVPSDEAEFVKAMSGVSDLPDLSIDTSKIADAYRIFFEGTYGVYPLLPGVDIITAGSDAEATYYFKSYTDTASGDVQNEYADVVVNVDTIYYPPTPLDCLVKIQRQRVSEVTRVENMTRGELGEVVSVTNNIGINRVTIVRVSYESGEPWSPEDTIQVDYSFLPYSDFHFRPCAIRYERLSEIEGGGYEVRYRIAVFAFPLYFLDNSNGEVSQMYRTMLEWFFWPFAH